MLEIKNFSLKLPNFSLKNIDLSISKGDIFALLGPSGSGKTLLLESIMGLTLEEEKIIDGKIILDGKDITKLPPEKRNIGIVYQDFALFPHLTVEENVTFGLRFKNFNLSEQKYYTNNLINRLEIKHLLKRYPLHLSGGEKQRVALARALALRPKLLLLDEPLSAIDPLFKEEIALLLKKLHKDFNLTYFIVSHNLKEVLYLANRGAIIKNGEILQKGPIEEIFKQPSCEFVARFVGLKNYFPVEIKNKKVLFDGSEIRADNYKKDAKFFSILPSKIKIFTNEPEKGYENILNGRVYNILNFDYYAIIQVLIGKRVFEVAISPNQLNESPLKIGQDIKIAFKKEAVRFF